NHTVLALAYSGDSKVLATAGKDGTVRLWDARTGEAGAVLRGHKGAVQCVAISRDGRLASGGADGLGQFWDLASGRLLETGKGHTGPVTCLAFNHDGKRLASGSDSPDTTVRVWESASVRPVYVLPRLVPGVTAVTFSPDGKWLAVADGFARRLHLHESDTG